MKQNTPQPRCESHFKNFKLCGDPATHRKLCPNGEYEYVCTYCFEALARAGEKGYEKHPKE